MRLFLASEVKHPESMEKLKKFVGGFESKSIAYIPTARNGEEAYGSWNTDSDAWKLVQTIGAKVTPVVLEEYKNSGVIDELMGKDIIWFAGGACGYLMYWIRRCEIDKYLLKILENGSVYVGSSAGSMITAKTLDIVDWYFGESEAGASVIPGLGLVDFDVYPHYEEDVREYIKNHYQGKQLYLLKNGEAITVVDGQIQILGEERIIQP